MTANLGNGLASPRRLASFVRAAGAGIVGLQEVDSEQAEEIEHELAASFPYRALYGTGFSGRGLLSRYPIVDLEQLHLADDRPDLLARLALPSQELTVIVAHPPPPRMGLNGVTFDPETEAQIDSLLALAVEQGGTIILGDFNMTPRNPAYERLDSAGLVDAFKSAGAGSGATFPVRPGRMRSINHRMHWVPLPAVTRIDYIWHTPDIQAVDAWVGLNVGSDHLPVVARLTPSDN